MVSNTRSSVRFQEEIDFSKEDFDELGIKYPICQTFCPEEVHGDICKCKRKISRHRDKAPHDAEEWEHAIRTYLLPAQYGRLANDGWFARLDIETELDKVEELLFKLWKLPEPKLIMSIIGGAKFFKLNDRLESNFIKGIVNVAEKANSWIVTTGYRVGIVQLVGQALAKVQLKKQDSKMIAIGICKWGSIKNVKELTAIRNNAKSKTRISQSDDSDEDEETHGIIRRGECHLEMNHTHYLMLDDGRYRHFDSKDFRANLCSCIAKRSIKKKQSNAQTPAVTIVVEGGPDTITNVYYDLKKNIPVVIINGSGRVADFLSRWFSYAKNVETDPQHADEVYGIDELGTNLLTQGLIETKTQKRLGNRVDVHADLHLDLSKKKLRQLFHKYEKEMQEDLKNLLYRDDDSDQKKADSVKAENKGPDKKLLDTLDQVMFCLQPGLRSHVTVYNLDSDNDLAETIFESICKAYNKSPKGKNNEKAIDERSALLNLAMDWNCIHVAKEFVFQNALDTIQDPNKYFIRALTDNLPTFVYEFLKLGLNPADVFFSKTFASVQEQRYKKFLDTLYTNDLILKGKPETRLKYFIGANEQDDRPWIGTVKKLNHALTNIIGDYMYDLYFNTEEEEMKHRNKWGLTQHHEKNHHNNIKDVESRMILTTSAQAEKARKCILRDLFLWAILMNRIDMAKVFLCFLKYRICPALIATKVLKQYDAKATYGAAQDEYKENIKYFEKYAMDCLDACNQENLDLACQLVVQQNELYGYVTCLQIASDAGDKLFIARPSSTQAMHCIWFDKLNMKKNDGSGYVALITGILSLGLLASPFVRYQENKKGAQIGSSPKRTLEQCGITYCDPYPLEYPRYKIIKPSINRYLNNFVNFHLCLAVKFSYHVISYIFFLLLFSYVLLFNFSPPTSDFPSIGWTEILTIILVSCMLIEEIHHFLTQDSLKLIGQAKSNFRDFFKSLTTIGFILFYIGLILRFTNAGSEEDFIAARVVMAIDIEIWWLRSLSFIIVIPFLGPHLVAIAKMLQDLLFFLSIIAVVMIAYGVASRSMVYYPPGNNVTVLTGPPDTSFSGRPIFRNILYPVYYLMYGDFGDELTNLDNNSDAAWATADQVLLAIHMIFVNILLVNLLIAMFSKRFNEVDEDTRNIWHSQQYLFTREYFTRSPFMPPISIIYNIYYLSRMLIFFIRRKFFHGSADRSAQKFKIIAMNKDRLEEWREFEGASTYKYAHNEVKALKAAPQKVKKGSDSSSTQKETKADNSDDLNEAADNVRELQDHLSKLNSTIEGMKLGFKNYFIEQQQVDVKNKK
ncbi:unnamed protein product [Rotaria socialis]|uniref:Uncharacterized protein n=1 Tax=Rotaria socialis TaxID=392032 RepID=A0A819WDE4_9BILA|nr:unnamed protein product [Rotaria socialis]CAF4122553.1 unnamed protein product [Rotaria socialis]CAF4442343.1 unnamed protein product [Rotaria socialis]